MSTPDTITPTATRPSWMLTISFWVALAALYFTSEIPIIFVIAVLIAGAHFTTWRLPRDSSATWILRLLVYGGVFTFFGGKPGMGADWIFDAKTFNMIGLIAAGEAVLELWREPPPGARYHSITVFCIGVVFLAACNTYDERAIKIFAPLYLLFTLLALREWHASANTPLLTLPRGRGFIALVLVLAIGGATHFSIVTQREQIARWGFRMMQQRRFFQSTGISEQPRLSSTFNLQGSTRRVLKIEGALNSPHLRAAAFDTYFRGGWTPPLSGRAKEAFPENPAKEDKNTQHARITKLGDLGGLILAPLNSVNVTPAIGSSFDWDKTLGPIRAEDPAPYTYEVSWNEEGSELGVPLHQGVLCEPVTAKTAARWLQLPPEVDPRVHELALELTETSLHPAEKAEAIAEYLMTNNKYARSTTRGAGDPVSNFILEKKAAHCEYFASATVVLLRASGVPSRYVTGYLAHEKDGNETTVRQRDAHAWAEAWIQGVGWVTVDATPADGTPEANEPVSAWQRAWEKFQDEFQRLREQATGLSRAQIIVLISLVVGIWFFERWRIRHKRQAQLADTFAYSAPEELRALASRFEKVLQKQNGDISEAKPLGEYSRDEAAERFLRDYNRARFGGALNTETVRELTMQIEALEKGHAKGQAHDTNTHADAKQN